LKEKKNYLINKF